MIYKIYTYAYLDSITDFCVRSQAILTPRRKGCFLKLNFYWSSAFALGTDKYTEIYTDKF